MLTTFVFRKLTTSQQVLISASPRDSVKSMEGRRRLKKSLNLVTAGLILISPQTGVGTMWYNPLRSLVPILARRLSKLPLRDGN